MKTPVWLWAFCGVSIVACGISAYRAHRLRGEYEAERQFAYEKLQSVLAETERLEESVARARVARNPKLVSLPEDKTIEVSRHNSFLMDGKGLPVGTRLSATIFDLQEKPILTHPTLSVQKGNVVFYPLMEDSLKPGEYELRLFREAKLIASYRFRAVAIESR